MIINIYGPAGSGKSQHKKTFARIFGTHRIFDEPSFIVSSSTEDDRILVLSQQPIQSADFSIPIEKVLGFVV